MNNNGIRQKILFFVPNGVGGAERMTLIYAGFAKEKGYSPEIVVVGQTDTEIRKMVDGAFSVRLIKARNIWAFCLCRIQKYIRDEKPYAVFSSFHYLNIRVILAAKKAGIPRVIIRCENNLDSISKITRSLVKRTYSKADIVIAQTDEMKEELFNFCMRYNKHKIVVLNNPIPKEKIDILVEEPSDYILDDSFINIVSVGRISKQKGQDILIESFNKIHRLLPSAKLHIIGGCIKNEQFQKELFRKVSSFGLEGAVSFYGHVENPYPIIRSAHCFILPSRWEGFPNALIEAQYLRVPSVCTSCIPSVSLIVKDGESGYIVPTEDSDAIAEGVLKALELKDIPFIYKGINAEDFCSLLI